MVKFTRTLTPDEVKILGQQPEVRLNMIIDNHISTHRNPDSAASRLLALVSNDAEHPTHLGVLRDAYEAVYGQNSISFNYVRSLITQLMSTGASVSVGHGFYVKAGV